jgi:predicted enzyme related to lactoylglutathione lyase
MNQGGRMPAKVGYLVIDAADPERLAPFWCGLLATGVDVTIGDGEFLVLAPTEDGLTVGFQRVPEAKAGKNRLHLDLVVDDLDEATAEVEKLGGQWLEPGNTRELEGFRWRCMADPEGNEFDIDVLPPG